MRHLLLTFVASVMTGSLLLGQDTPAEQDRPARPEGVRDGTQREAMRERFRDMREGRGRWQRPVEDAEWKDISVFIKEHFPHRWEVYERKSQEPNHERLAEEMKQRIADRYRMLKRIETSNPGLYETLLKQATAEDEAFGASRAWRNATDDQQASAEATLRDKVRTLVQTQLDERAKRLEEARATITAHEKRLAEDRKNIEELVSAQMERFMSENPFRGPPEGGPWPTRRPRDEASGEGRDGPVRDGPVRDGPPGERPPRDARFDDLPLAVPQLDGPPPQGDAPQRERPERERPERERPQREPAPRDQ